VRQTGCKDTAFSHSTKLYDKSFDFYFQENLSGKLKFIQLNCFLISQLLNHFKPQSFSLKAAAKVMLIFKLPNFLRKIISFLFDTFFHYLTTVLLSQSGCKSTHFIHTNQIISTFIAALKHTKHHKLLIKN